MNKLTNITLRGLWNDIQSSLWYRPALISLFSVTLVFIASYIDKNTSLQFYVISADNARAVLTVIASSMLTVVTLTFSILMVALTLTSQQFSPRVLRSFTSDRAAQNILGILIGSFLYSLLVLVTVIDTNNTTFVPLLSILIAIGLALLGIASFIFFIDHIAKSIRVSYIIQTINDETTRLIQSQVEDQVVGHKKSDIPLSNPVMDQTKAVRIDAEIPGYIQAIDVDMLATLAKDNKYTIQIAGMSGDFVAKGRPLLYVWNQHPSSKDHETTETESKADAHPDNGDEKARQDLAEISDALTDKFRRQFDIGVERTTYKDILFGIRQLVDIALKALSPGINDPTTATNCIHFLTNILIQAIHCPDQEISHYDDDGNLCLIGRTVSFSTMVDQTYDQLRHFSATDPTMLEALLISLIEVARETVDKERLNILWQHTVLIRDRAEGTIQQKHDRSKLNNRLLQIAELLDEDYESIALDG